MEWLGTGLIPRADDRVAARALMEIESHHAPRLNAEPTSQAREAGSMA